MLAPSPTPRPLTIDDLLGPALIARLDRFDLLSRKVFAGKLPGERRSKRRGHSVEFDDYRSYVPGDDLRRIDWNVFARFDRFFVKLFREEEDLALHLVIDASPSMDAGDPSKLVLAQRLAMALGYIGLVNQNRVIASVIGFRGAAGPLVRQLTPLRGRRGVKRLADFILRLGRVSADEAPGATGESVDATGRTPPSLNRALRQIALGRSGKGVLVLLSDFLVREDIREGLNYLAAGRGVGGFDTYCLQVLSPGELEPEREADSAGARVVGDLRLMDVESGASTEVTISAALLRTYKRRLEELTAGLHGACAARAMAHAIVRSDADVGLMMGDYLRRRGLVG